MDRNMKTEYSQTLMVLTSIVWTGFFGPIFSWMLTSHIQDL